jgi:hypothetical protein
MSPIKDLIILVIVLAVVAVIPLGTVLVLYLIDLYQRHWER